MIPCDSHTAIFSGSSSSVMIVRMPSVSCSYSFFFMQTQNTWRGSGLLARLLYSSALCPGMRRILSCDFKAPQPSESIGSIKFLGSEELSRSWYRTLLFYSNPDKLSLLMSVVISSLFGGVFAYTETHLHPEYSFQTFGVLKYSWSLWLGTRRCAAENLFSSC